MARLPDHFGNWIFTVRHDTYLLTWINDIINSVDCERRFSDIRSDDNFAGTGRCRVENPGLHFWRKCRVNRKDDQFRHFRSETFHSFVENFTSCVDFLLTWSNLIRNIEQARPSQNIWQTGKYSGDLNSELLNSRNIWITNFYLFAIQIPANSLLFKTWPE